MVRTRIVNSPVLPAIQSTMPDHKVDLLIEPMGGFHNYEIGPRPKPVRLMLPWYASNMRGQNGLSYARRTAGTHRRLCYL